MFAEFIAPLPSQPIEVREYAGFPAIVLSECTGNLEINGLDGEMVCNKCNELRSRRGSANPSIQLNHWYAPLSRAVERSAKPQLTPIDYLDARNFAKVASNQLSPDGQALKDEAKAQSEYCAYMANLTKSIPVKVYKPIAEGSVPGIYALFKDAAELCEKNPSFRSSLVFALLTGAVAREK